MQAEHLRQEPWLRAWMACRCVYHPETCVCAGGRTASERQGLKLASAYWCGRRGHVSVSLKIVWELRWGGVFPADQTRCHCGDASPNKSMAVRARFCLDPHLYFPTAPLLTWEPGESSGSPVLYLATSPLSYKHREELQRRNPHFSKTAVTRKWRVPPPCWGQDTHSAFFKQIQQRKQGLKMKNLTGQTRSAAISGVRLWAADVCG